MSLEFHAFIKSESIPTRAAWQKAMVSLNLPIELDNVYVTESWLIEDRENDKSRKFGFDLPEGTWMVGMKVENDKVWSKVKKGELRGLSVEGYFTEKLLFNKDEELLLEINNILKNIKDD